MLNATKSTVTVIVNTILPIALYAPGSWAIHGVYGPQCFMARWSSSMIPS